MSRSIEYNSKEAYIGQLFCLNNSMQIVDTFYRNERYKS